MVKITKIFVLIIMLMLPASPCLFEVMAEEVKQKEEFVYNDHDKRDPLWPLVNASGAILNYDKDLMVADMVLDGIMVDNTGNNVAIINGMIVNLNDKISFFIVKTINSDSVVLKKGEETVTLKLKKEE
ncbi:MAG: hypothetical protein KAR05_07050 [Candidatus Omnitrophica bacterium]|nr:hypothetical protein [Candidatus Omnitrophota bacterium]